MIVFTRPIRGSERGNSASGRVWRLRITGFTLLELLLVVALIAVLGGLVLGAGRYARENGRRARASAEITALAAALEAYRLAEGDYPRTARSADVLQALIGRRGPTGETIATGALLEVARFSTAPGADPFLDDATELIDPWGSPYLYAYKTAGTWTNPSYVLYSAGPNSLADAVLLTGGFPNRTSPGNEDNLWANPP